MNRLLAKFALASAFGAAAAARAQTAQPDAPAVAPTMNSDFFGRLIQAYGDVWNPPVVGR